MLADDFTAFAGRIHVVFGNEREAPDLRRMISRTISGIADECDGAGARLIGHIKCIAEDAKGKYVACSVVSSGAEATCRGELSPRSKTLDIVMNVLIYGLDRELVEDVVVGESVKVFRPEGGDVRFENLEFIKTGHECDEDHDHGHEHNH
jgi:hypothetical protein